MRRVNSTLEEGGPFAFMKQRRELLGAIERIVAQRLTPGRSGNLSVRVPGGMLLTPSGVPYESLGAHDLVLVDSRGEVSRRSLAPSTEWHFHSAIYAARPGVCGIVHTHSRFATAVSVLRRDIPAFHYMVAVAGGVDIRCARYATFGTPELAHEVLVALQGRKACLLANHGQVAVGETVAEAVDLACEVETLAEQFTLAMGIGTPVILDSDEMQRVLEKLEKYGVPRATEP